jgi:hypothetical protein
MIPIGIQEQGGSEELDERVTAIENQEDMENVFVEMPNFSFQANILTIYSGWIWKLLGVTYSNPANVSFPIDYCAAGKSRFEYFVPNNENGFTRITGEETLGTAQAPQLPAHGLYVTFFLVTDSAIGIPKQPNIAKTPNIQEILDEGYSTTNIIWFFNNENSKCLGLSSERLLFQKLESVFNEIRADNTTETYHTQLPNKTGGAEETIAMVSDLEDKEDKTNKGVANGYAPLNEFAKIASEYLNVVNDLVTGGETALASAEMVKTLKTQIDGIQLLLNADDVNLDTVQERIDMLKSIQLTLDTILVNDLTTGGTTKAATAETVKVLKGLIDALTTVVGNKVDKVAGERLINAAEITKLAGLGSIATTIKPILSTALATQNVAGFVTYINALNPVLVVGASEIVKYILTDTGRVFELNLRGRSFGTGQPAIVAADVLEVTDFLNKDIKLSNYPSTRNDGQLPTNKALAPDINGNLKLYSIAIAPAPWIKELIPDSYYPNTTGNIRILGDFFTLEMCDRVNNPNAIIIGGVTTIHYATFVNSEEILVNVTTGSIEGNFSITLNNGLQTVKANALLIVLGEVYTPTDINWINKTGDSDTTIAGEFKVLLKDVLGTGVIDPAFFTIPTTSFIVNYKYKKSPLDASPTEAYNDYTLFQFIDLTTNAVIYETWFEQLNTNANGRTRMWFGDRNSQSAIAMDLFTDGLNALETYSFSLKRLNNILSFYVNGNLLLTPAIQYASQMKVKVSVREIDIVNIKLIIPQ